MKTLRVNMSTGAISSENSPDSLAEYGGRGLIAELLTQEVPPTCDPLGPDNKLVLAMGLLSGTIFVNSSRISVGAKSPLTGGIKESNAGGTIGTALGKTGIKSVIIEDQPTEGSQFILKITKEGGASLEPADDYKGLRTYALMEKLHSTFGEKISVLCIGPAGDKMLASASIQASDVDGRPCRAAGRGGLGAVMGSKGLKAIVVESGGTNGPPIADMDAFKEAMKTYANAVKEHPLSGKGMPLLGTAALVAPVNSVGAFPSYNATKGTMDGWEKISGETMVETMKQRGGNPTHRGCSQCIIHCSNVYADKDGGYVTSSLEFETIWSMGGMTGIDDLDTIARLDFLCDDIGLDTMNTGVAVAVAMDSGYKPFGDKEAAIEMVEAVCGDSEMGRLIGTGPSAVGKHFNNPRVPVVKNQSIAGYDPRPMPANGVTYATSPMGADHTAGNLVGEYLEGAIKADQPEGHVEASKGIQPVMAFVDCAGICLFGGFALATPEGGGAFFKAMGAMLGRPFGPGDMIEMGSKCLTLEHAFNRNAGLTAADDRLPEFFKTEPLAPTGATFNITDAELDSVFGE
jgi:aldehyde:ferredoxin oxidoreductase